LGWNAPIDDPLINAKTDFNSILYQASIFNAVGRVFVHDIGKQIILLIYQAIKKIQYMHWQLLK
jgi:hypothetical protein